MINHDSLFDSYAGKIIRDSYLSDFFSQIKISSQAASHINLYTCVVVATMYVYKSIWDATCAHWPWPARKMYTHGPLPILTLALNEFIISVSATVWLQIFVNFGNVGLAYHENIGLENFNTL